MSSPPVLRASESEMTDLSPETLALIDAATQQLELNELKNIFFDKITIPEQAFIIMPFWDGCLSASIPLGFLDVSAIRPVPDHQDVFFHMGRDAGITVELNTPVSPQDHMAAAQLVWDDLMDSQDVHVSKILATGFHNLEHFPRLAPAAQTIFYIDGIHTGRHFQDETKTTLIRTYIFVIRYPQYDTDVTIIFDFHVLSTYELSYTTSTNHLVPYIAPDERRHSPGYSYQQQNVIISRVLHTLYFHDPSIVEPSYNERNLMKAVAMGHPPFELVYRSPTMYCDRDIFREKAYQTNTTAYMQPSDEHFGPNEYLHEVWGPTLLECVHFMNNNPKPKRASPSSLALTASLPDGQWATLLASSTWYDPVIHGDPSLYKSIASWWTLQNTATTLFDNDLRHIADVSNGNAVVQSYMDKNGHQPAHHPSHDECPPDDDRVNY